MTGVSEEILNQALIFGQAMAVGAGMAAVYDGIRIFRRILRHGIVLLSLEDVLYWIAASVTEFALFYRVNYGRLRLYLFLGSVLGATIYYVLVGRFLIRIASRLILSVKKRLKNMRKAVTMKGKFAGNERKSGNGRKE